MYMDDEQELCDTGLVLGLNYDARSGITDEKPRRITSESLKLERSSSNLASISNTTTLELTLGLFDGKYESPKVSVTGEQKICGLLGKVQSPTQSTLSSFSDDHQVMLGAKMENDTESDDPEKVASHMSGDGDDQDEDGNAKKKLRLTKEQSVLLEHKFKEHATLNPKQKQALAKQLNLRPRQVEVWFQNRRARTKLKQTQVDCEFLKKCCETLTEENRRLQKELQELRAVNRSASTLYMQVPKAAFTVCPSCEKISGNSDLRHASIKGSTTQPKPHFFNPFAHSATC